MSDKDYTEEEIRENVERRIEVAVDLLEDHPYVIGTWSSLAAREFSAFFTQVDPDTDMLEGMLDLECYGTWLVNGSEKDYVNEDRLLVERGWDVPFEYHSLKKNGEKAPFTEWSENYEWTTGIWQRSIEEFLEDAGWSK